MRRQKKLFFLFSFFSFLLFIIFSFLVKKDLLSQFDLETMVWIQNRLPKSVDPYLSIFSLVGSFEITLLILILFLILNSAPNIVRDWSLKPIFKKILGIIIPLFNFAFAHLIEIIGKLFLDHPTPPKMFSRYDLPFFFPSSSFQTGFSYPSGHSLRTVFLAVIFFFLIIKSKKLTLKSKILFSFLNFSFVFLMLVSRVSLGEHWPTDVIGGSLLGLTFVLFSLIFL